MSATETHRYVDAKDVSKTVRARLKTSFPGTKFSVRTEHYTAVNIGWMDGPTVKQVEPLTWGLSGGHFDGMQDMYIDNGGDLFASADGSFETVHSMAKYIFTDRDISPEWTAAVFALFSGLIGRELDPGEWGVWNQRVPLRVDYDGELHRMGKTEDGDYLNTIFHQFCYPREGGSVDVSATSREP